MKVLVSKTPKVYKNKKLNKATFAGFSHNDYQVFLHLVSKIGGVDGYGKYLQQNNLNKEYTLTANDFSSVFQVDIHHSYRVLKKAVDKLMRTDIRIEKEDNSGFSRINICSMADYNKNCGSITVHFTDHIMPYLAQVREKFVLYNLKEVANFGSLYTTRLYELIQEFKETGWMIKSVDELREIFAVGSKFKAYKDFKKYTFAHACQEINDNYNVGLRFEERKKGRKVDLIEFFFKKTMVHRVINQKTGITRNIYEKSKPQLKRENNKKSKTLENKILDLEADQKPIKNVVSSIFTKLFQKK